MKKDDILLEQLMLVCEQIGATNRDMQNCADKSMTALFKHQVEKLNYKRSQLINQLGQKLS